MFCSEVIIDADHDDKGGWEIVLRLDAESMEASWTDLDDTALRIRAHSIGAALVETLIAERNRA